MRSRLLTGYLLPRRFFNSRNLAAGRHFAEANTAEAEHPHIAVLAAAPKTAPHEACAEFGFLFAASND